MTPHPPDPDSDPQELLDEILTWCERHHVTRSRFGVLVMRDSAFVGRLRMGLRPTERTITRILDYIAREGAPPTKVRGARPEPPGKSHVHDGSSGDAWLRDIRRGSHKLAGAIRRAHPERFAPERFTSATGERAP